MAFKIAFILTTLSDCFERMAMSISMSGFYAARIETAQLFEDER